MVKYIYQVPFSCLKTKFLFPKNEDMTWITFVKAHSVVQPTICWLSDMMGGWGGWRVGGSVSVGGKLCGQSEILPAGGFRGCCWGDDIRGIFWSLRAVCQL